MTYELHAGRLYEDVLAACALLSKISLYLQHHVCHVDSHHACIRIHSWDN